MNKYPLTKEVCVLDLTGAYLGTTEADLDVVANDGSYILPAGCVDAPVPEPRAGRVAVWNGKGWEYVEDYRGMIAYQTADRQQVVIGEPGALPAGLTFDPPPSDKHVWRAGKWVLTKAAAAELLALAKKKRIAELNNAAQAVVAAGAKLDETPDFEVQTWPIQAAEARAWQADPEADTPVLDAIADERGIERAKLKAAALRKAMAFEVLTARVVGMRQALQGRIEAAKTQEELDAVEFVFDLGVAK